MRITKEEHGRREAHYQSSYFAEARILVWARARGRCEEPGCRCSGRDVHHVRYEGVLYRELEPGNLKYLMLLCPEHHLAKHPQHQRPRPEEPRPTSTLEKLEKMIRDFRP